MSWAHVKFHTSSSTGIPVKDAKQVWDGLRELDHFTLWPTGGMLPPDMTSFIWFPNRDFSLNIDAPMETRLHGLREASREDVMNSMAGCLFDNFPEPVDHLHGSRLEAILRKLPTLPRFNIVWSNFIPPQLPLPMHDLHARLVRCEDWIEYGLEADEDTNF